MNKLPAAGGSLPSSGASPHLLGAALAGLLCLANCSDPNGAAAPVGAGGGAHEGAAPSVSGSNSQAGKGGAATAGGAGASSGGADSSSGGAAGAGMDAAGMSGAPLNGAGDGGAAGAAGAPGSAGSTSAGAGGMQPEAPHITSSENVGVLSEEQFKTLCDARSGAVEVMPHCGGFATAKGFSYDSGTQLLSEHTCQGTNTCAGWNCVID